MTLDISRRSFLTGAASALIGLAAPAIVRAENLMPLYVPKPPAPSIMIWQQAPDVAAFDIIMENLRTFGSAFYRVQPNGEVRVFNPETYRAAEHGPAKMMRFDQNAA